MNNNNLDPQQKISNQVAFVVILIFGLIASWITVNVGNKIISRFSSGKAADNIQKNYELLQEKPPLQNKTLQK